MLHKGLLGEREEGGRKGGGEGEGVHALQVVVFVPISMPYVNKSEIYRKKVSRIFGFFTFLPYICTVDETKRGVLKVQIKLFNILKF